MKSLIEIDYSILKEYENFENVNNNWNIASYLNTFYSTNDAVAFSKFFFPNFESIDNCIILSERYNSDIFEGWKAEFNGDVSSIEKMSNLYELSDYFHINDKLDDYYESSIKQLGLILKRSLEINLSLLFPERKFRVELFQEYDSDFITFYSINDGDVIDSTEKG